MKNQCLGTSLSVLVIVISGSLACTHNSRGNAVSRKQAAGTDASWTFSGLQGELGAVNPRDTRAGEVALTRAYVDMCLEALGTFPEETIDCNDAQPMPVMRTKGGASRELLLDDLPASILRTNERLRSLQNDEDREVTSCDAPSLIFRDLQVLGCMTGSRIRRVSRDSTDWIYVCRRSHKFVTTATRADGTRTDVYNEIGLIGYNRDPGKTCFFAGKPVAEIELKDEDRGVEPEEPLTVTALLGNDIPPPGRDLEAKHWAIPIGREGCTACHSHGPWLNFPFVMGYEESDRAPVVPEPNPGMLYEPINPTMVWGGGEWSRSELASRNFVFSDTFKGDLAHALEWHEPKRLVPKLTDPNGVAQSGGVASVGRLCTTCHQIGDGTYILRYPTSVFVDPAIEVKDPRARLYFDSLSPGHDNRTKGSHRRPDHDSWRPTVTAGFAEYADFQTAVNAISKCTNNADCWGEHWTLDRLATQDGRLEYLRETCSYCHQSGGIEPELWTLEDFRGEYGTYGNPNRPYAKLVEDGSIHPPKGRLPATVLELLKQDIFVSSGK